MSWRELSGFGRIAPFASRCSLCRPLFGEEEVSISSVQRLVAGKRRSNDTSVRALIAGGGAPEIEVSQKLMEYAKTLKGMEQYCFQAFAEALEIIPTTLAENAGLNPIAIVTELRNRHAHGEKTAGINVKKGTITNILEENVLQPLLVSTSAVELAAETVKMILKIDDLVSSTRISGNSKENSRERFIIMIGTKSIKASNRQSNKNIVFHPRPARYTSNFTESCAFLCAKLPLIILDTELLKMKCPFYLWRIFFRIEQGIASRIERVQTFIHDPAKVLRHGILSRHHRPSCRKIQIKRAALLQPKQQ